MKSNSKFGIFVVIITCLLIIFSSVGYAALNTNLSISGEASVELTREWNFRYNGKIQEFVAPYTGVYWIKLYGAGSGANGFGMLTEGKIHLNENEVIYIVLGEKGKINGSTSSFNGGGAAGSGGIAGGGASDVRLVSGSTVYDWSNFNSLKSRIMVASGAGGKDGETDANGGGLYGTQAINTGYFNQEADWYLYPDLTKLLVGSYPTQKIGGSYATFNIWRNPNDGTVFPNGTFGVGANDTHGTAWGWTDYAGGGGGGYYGGGSTSKGGSAGGGSSFMSGYAGSNAITSGSTSSNITHTNNTLHYSGKYFRGGVFATAHNQEDGKADIYYVGSQLYTWKTEVESFRYIKSCMNGNSVDNYAKWSEIQVIQNGVNIAKGKTVTATFPTSTAANLKLTNLTDGDIDTSGGAYGSYTGNQCITLDMGSIITPDQVGYFGYFLDGRTSYNNIFQRSTDGTNWVNMHNVSSYKETSEGSHYQDW